MSDEKHSALLLVDVITDFNFEDGDRLFKATLPMLGHLKRFRDRCFKVGMPIIYVNDPPKNRSQSTDDLIEHVSRSDRGRFMLREIGPANDASVILKPQRSGFFETPLEDTLHRLGIDHVYITGITTDICVLFTAHDAYMRRFRVSVPSDCVAAVEEEFHADALKFLARVAEADISAQSSANAPGFVTGLVRKISFGVLKPKIQPDSDDVVNR